jgi:hypothetical protein
MTAIIFKHKGNFDSHTKENRALRFIHKYVKAVSADLSLPYSDTKFYAPAAVFFDTKNVTYSGAAAIKTWMLKLFSPFDKVELEGMSFIVMDESTKSNALYTATVETMVKFFVKGDPVPISVPRMFIFEIRDSVSDDGFDGLQFFDIKLYWDTALLSNEIKRRREEL